MSSHGCIRVIVFDFDGTLIQSNAPKREVFFDLFPGGRKQHLVVDGVLREFGEESRYVILKQILAKLGEVRDSGMQVKVDQLADRYNELVFKAVSVCPEMPGASETLAHLGRRYTLYVSSGTPVESLKALIVKREWQEHFKDVFGYPNTKTESLKVIASQEACEPAAMLVVGDGSSDRNSANDLGCHFFPVEDREALTRLVALMT